MAVYRGLILAFSLTIVVLLAGVMLAHTAPKPALKRERILYMHYDCMEGQPGVRKTEFVVYGPNCSPVFIFY
jgi:hypothetical protein